MMKCNEKLIEDTVSNENKRNNTGIHLARQIRLEFGEPFSEEHGSLKDPNKAFTIGVLNVERNIIYHFPYRPL